MDNRSFRDVNTDLICQRKWINSVEALDQSVFGNFSAASFALEPKTKNKFVSVCVIADPEN